MSPDQGSAYLKINKTKLHSSRMHTDRRLTVVWDIQGGVGVDACLVRGVDACLVRGGGCPTGQGGGWSDETPTHPLWPDTPLLWPDTHSDQTPPSDQTSPYGQSEWAVGNYLMAIPVYKVVHSGFETKRRRHQKSKTEVSVAPKKGILSSKKIDGHAISIFVVIFILIISEWYPLFHW